MKKLLHSILLLIAFGVAQASATSLAVWLTTSSTLSKDECVFLSEIIREGAVANVSSEVKVQKGKKKPADYYVESSVTKMGSKYHIVVELYRTEGKQLLNSYSNRTNDVDVLTDELEKSMPGFFGAVVAVDAGTLQEPAEPVSEDVAAPEEPAAPMEEPAGITDVAEVAAPAEEPVPLIEIDLSNIQYFDNGKSGVLAPTGAADPSYNQYETFVWSNVVTSGVGADGGAGGSSGGKSGGLPVWAKVLPYALGAGFLIAGIVENGQIEKERENYDNACDRDSAQKYWDNLEFLRSARNVFYGVGLGLVGAGVVITVAF